MKIEALLLISFYVNKDALIENGGIIIDAHKQLMKKVSNGYAWTLEENVSFFFFNERYFRN